MFFNLRIYVFFLYYIRKKGLILQKKADVQIFK